MAAKFNLKFSLELPDIFLPEYSVNRIMHRIPRSNKRNILVDWSVQERAALSEPSGDEQCRGAAACLALRGAGHRCG